MERKRRFPVLLMIITLLAVMGCQTLNAITPGSGLPEQWEGASE